MDEYERRNRMQNIAHRGYSSKYPENTLLAFDKALIAGATGLEFDVQLSKDGVPIVFHDEKIDRITKYKGYLKDYTAEELKEMTVQDSDELIIDLDTFLKEYSHIQDLIFNIELKNNVIAYEDIESKVYNLVKKYEVIDQVIVSSFNQESIGKMKSQYPEIKCGLIIVDYSDDLVNYLNKTRIEYCHPLLEKLDEKTVFHLTEQGIKVNAWTSKKPTNIGDIQKLNLNGLISNYPAYIHKNF